MPLMSWKERWEREGERERERGERERGGGKKKFIAKKVINNRLNMAS